MWVKKGLIYSVKGNKEWMTSHAQVPTVDKVSEDKVRIYYCTRDNKNRSLTTFIECEASEPKKILYEHNNPILPLGKLGTFDDSGVMPSCIINHDGRKYLYYIGWNTGITARYRVAHGLAISNDNGETFEKYI